MSDTLRLGQAAMLMEGGAPATPRSQRARGSSPLHLSRAIRGNPLYLPRKRFEMESIRAMRFFQDRGANVIGAEQTGEAREGFVKLVWIAQGCFKQTKLLLGRFNRLGLQGNRNNGIIRLKIFEMRVQHPKEKINIVSRLRNFETTFVILLT